MRQLEQRVLVLVTLGLVAFGLVMVFSATSASAAIGEGDPMYFLVKQGLYALAGVALLLVLSRFDYHRLRALAPLLLVAALVACVAVLALGPPINGARRWFLLGPVSLQPSEFAKLAICLWVAAVLARRPAPQTMAELMKPVGWVVAIFGALILLEPDLGTTIALFLMVAGILLVSGTPLRLLFVSTTLALALGAAAIWFEPYRRARLLSFLDPWKDPEGAGFQSVQAMIGIGSGGITGEGLGQGIQKINFLPEAHTDMIFAVIGEELGLRRGDARGRRVLRLRLGRLQDRDGLRRPVRETARRGHHDARLRPGGGQPRRRARHRAAHGHPPAVRVLRGVVSRRTARRGGHPP